MGSPRFKTFEAKDYSIVDAWFPPHAYLPPHTHDRPIFGVMLDGAFDSEIAHRTLDCSPATAWVEPLGERHANRIGCQGAHVLVVQPVPGAFPELAPFLGAVQHLRHGAVAADAWRLSRELTAPDDVTPLITDGLLQTMLATAVRRHRRKGGQSTLPYWLLRAQEFIHAHFRDRIALAEVASAADITAHHLAREFRCHFGTTVGDYVRRLRVEWVATELERGASSLSLLAIAAGFSDQSHLTREFSRRMGMSPGGWRARYRDFRR
jgi:AraC family transcriptional regulator